MTTSEGIIGIFKNSPFLRHNAVFFIGSMLVAFMNYLYYPVVGRLLSNISFGEVQVIVSSFMQMTIILNVLSTVAINIYVNQKDKKVANATVQELEKLALYIGLGILLLVIVLSGSLQHALKFSSPYPFIAIAVAFVITIPLTFQSAYLRAQQDFKAASITSFLASLAKLIFSTVFVLMALHTFGAILGIVVSQVVGYFYSNWVARRSGYRQYVEGRGGRKPNWELLKPQIPFALFVLCMSLITTLQISIDVTLVKYYLSPETAGSYAAIATVARIIFFLTGSVTAVMLSSVGSGHTINENMAMLKKSLSLTFMLGGIATLVFCALPVLVIHLLLGSRYDMLAHLLPLLSLTIFIGSLVTLFTSFCIAMRNYVSLSIVITGFIISIGFILLSPKTVEEIVTGLLVGNSIILAGLVAYTIFTYAPRRRWLHG